MNWGMTEYPFAAYSPARTDCWAALNGIIGGSYDRLNAGALIVSCRNIGTIVRPEHDGQLTDFFVGSPTRTPCGGGSSWLSALPRDRGGRPAMRRQPEAQ